VFTELHHVQRFSRLMLMLEPLFISKLLDEYRSGERTPEDTIRDVYVRIRSAADDHVWIHLVPESDALRAARDLTGGPGTPPLYGIPFAVKDNIDVAGLPTTAGCPAYVYTPTESATVVKKALAAGAILIGKTNMDQFATGLVGTRSPYGACANAFNAEYISGGSSSGSAVAVAKGLVAFSLGTDTAGSGRVPAALNGIVGVKPSRGLVSAAGVVPACRSLDCVSVFAADTNGAGQVLEVLAGPDPRDAFCRVAAQLPTNHAPPKIGIPPDDQCEFFGDDASKDAWTKAVQRAVDLGAQLVEFDLAPFNKAASLLYSGPFVAERYAAVGDFVRRLPPEEMDPTVRQIVLGSSAYSAAEAFQAQYELEELKRVTSIILNRVDALLLPTTPTTYKISEVQNNPLELNSRLGIYTNFVNLLDLSGIALPSGLRRDGLPFGITLLAPAFGDRKLLHLAHWWERTASDREYLGQPDAGVLIAVVGAHLSGQPLNWQLTRRAGTLIQATTTAPYYRLYALPETIPKKPGLIRAADRQDHGIEVEVWRLSTAAFGEFVAEIPPPLGIGTLQLADNSQVKGFLCEPYVLGEAEDITQFRAWRKYIESRS
jgi:allophanate hydrolase